MDNPLVPGNSRVELLRAHAPFNQIRNAIYHLIRFIEEQHLDPVEELRRMGREIAKTFARYWLPSKSSTEDLVTEIYGFVTGSKVSVKVTGSIARVVDKHCRLCKYIQEGMPVPGCELITGMVAEFTTQYRAQDLMQLTLEVIGVEHSRTRGDKRCEHLYKVQLT